MDPESHALAIGSQMRDVTLRRWLDDAVDKADEGVPYRIVEPLGARHPNYPAHRNPAVRLKGALTGSERGRRRRAREAERMAKDPAYAARVRAGRRERHLRAKARRLMQRAMGPGWIPCADAPKG